MLRYRLLLLALSLPLIAITVWQAIRDRDIQLILQRLGLSIPSTHDGNTKPIWIHASPVGEVSAIIPFIHLLQERYPQQPLLVSTNTATGKQVLKKHCPDIAHTYLVFDWALMASRFVRRIKPACALIFETEIWPNLFATVTKQNIPLIIFNGRVSNKLLKAQQRFAAAYRYALQHVTTILARSENDKQHFITLGAAAQKIEVVGNIKYAIEKSKTPSPIELPRPYILAASTRDGEEKYLLETLKDLLGDVLLVIAPRHPQRRADIENDLAELNLSVVVRSRKETVTASTAIYLADTLGELNNFIAGAEFVVMGGAFLPFGGHNILEVGQLGKAVIFGSHMSNFANEAETFVENHAALQVNDKNELREAVQQLIQQPEKAQQLGQQGKALMVQHADIAETYLNKIEQHCPTLQKAD